MHSYMQVAGNDCTQLSFLSIGLHVGLKLTSRCGETILSLSWGMLLLTPVEDIGKVLSANRHQLYSIEVNNMSRTGWKNPTLLMCLSK